MMVAVKVDIITLKLYNSLYKGDVMSFSVNTNISAMTANLNSNLSSQSMNSSLNSLATGSQINSAADNASGMTIADQLSAQVRGMGQSIMNANDSIGMIQIADGAMSGVSENMDRIRELTLKASSPIMNSSNLASIQNEIDGLMESSNNILNQTSYNGMKLFGEDSPISSESSLGTTVDITTVEGLAQALESIDSMKSGINEVRSDLGSQQNKLASEINNMSVGQINTASAESQIRDVDFAQESANFSKENLMSQIGSFVQSQANANTANIAKLFS